MKIKLSIIILILTSQISFAQNLVETYYRSGFNNSGRIELYANGTFIKKGGAISCAIGEDGKTKNMSVEIVGEYQIDKSHLRTIPKKKLLKRYQDNEEQEVPGYIKGSSYDIVEYKGIKILFANEQLKEDTGFDLRSVNLYIYMANVINQKDDKIGFDTEFWCNTKLKPKETIWIEKDIKEYYPKELKEYILDVPLMTRIKKVEEVSFFGHYQDANPNWRRYRITFDAGKKSGVKPRMVFYIVDKDGSEPIEMIKIIDVLENECTGYVKVNSSDYLDIVGKSYSTKKKEE